MLIKTERKEWFKYLNIYPYEVKSPRLQMSRIAGQAKKNESSANLPGKPFQGDIFKKNISKFEKSNVSEKMGKNENLVFYLINYAKNTVKLTNFSVLVLKEDVS